MTKILVDLTEVESFEVPSGIHLKIENFNSTKIIVAWFLVLKVHHLGFRKWYCILKWSFVSSCSDPNLLIPCWVCGVLTCWVENCDP